MTRRILLLVLLLAALVGCGTGVQPRPEPIRVDTPNDRPRPPADGTAAVRIYLVRDGRLAAVTRRAPPTPDAALALLAAGPTPAESAGGLRVALGDRPVGTRPDPADPGTMLVDVSEEYAELPRPDRVLATAQIVWTLTENPTVRHVRLQLDGRPLVVPTDTGPRAGPVRRSDFRSVAPR